MQIAAEKFCCSCGISLPTIATLCAHCGRDLRGDAYQIIREGLDFGISLKGLIVLHDMSFEEALQVALIMNAAKQA